ncbi:acyl-CoA dehydrogenase [Rhizoctonia solani]|uniref:Acyl-CoA dehydrogenase n=1 Tax=Rhizoctonia solani TaxID=456999 RepID=A0A8H8SUP4_9AGAM|nr:acyl-CoA dehydrogenase [Rhizoctonia solani]QRW17607.1 acyl-CoA dehydrogenase [Rhizoctonia solani]
MSTKEMKVLTREEVAKHNKEGDLWIIVDSVVFDLSKFAAMHPGGLSVLLDEEIAGQDATEAFFSLHRQEVLAKPQYQRLQIGTIHGESKQIKALAIGELSQVPYAEPSWLSSGFHSAYYSDNHREFQKAVRKFVDEYVIADGQAREEDGKRISQSVLDKMAEIEMHAMRLGPGKHLKGRTLMGGIVKPEQFDYFHELIVTQELTRVGARGYGDGLLGGMVIGLPPVLNFAKPALRDKIVPDIFAGKKASPTNEIWPLKITAGNTCTAVKSADGSHWTINGTKKWITNATFSDYFTVGCKTEKGLTVFLVPRGEGVETKPIKTSYSPTAGTGYITFDNVKVPSENMLGPENGGLLVILSNFNHERWVMCCASARSQRLIVEECLKWANQRKVFGKPLISQAVIRHKLAAMIARVESGQNWLETSLTRCVTWTISSRDCYRCHPDFGGRAITKTGMGRMIEHYHRTVPFDSLLGGAEDVLGDLGVRQAIRKMPKNARL